MVFQILTARKEHPLHAVKAVPITRDAGMSEARVTKCGSLNVTGWYDKLSQAREVWLEWRGNGFVFKI